MIQIFKSIGHKDSKQTFSLNIQLNEESLALTFFENNNTWQSNISCHDVGEFAEQHNLSKEEYFSKLKIYLMDTPENIELKFAKNEFICYCKIQNGMNLKYFSTIPHKIDLKFNQLLELYSSQGEKLRQENENVFKERDQLMDAKVNLENKLKELVERKLKDEEELYSNFALVLNEKKRKIQQLNQLLQAFKAGRPVKNREVRPTVKLKTDLNKQVKNEVSESDSDNGTDEYEYNTDEETVNKSKNIQEVLPTTSKQQNFDVLFDDEDSPNNLPKRSKISHFKKNKQDEAISSTSKVKEEKPANCQMEVEEDSPNVGYNTQDLLDCI